MLEEICLYKETSNNTHLTTTTSLLKPFLYLEVIQVIHQPSFKFFSLPFPIITLASSSDRNMTSLLTEKSTQILTKNPT